MADLHDKFYPYDDMNVTVLKALARLPLSVNECEELLEMDSHMLMVEHELDHVQADTVRMWTQHELQRHSASSVTGASAKGAADLRDMSKWQPTRTYPIKENRRRKRRRVLKETVADDRDFEVIIQNAAAEVAATYEEMMGERLFDEDPEMFRGRSTRDEWISQAVNAGMELEAAIEEAIRQAISRNEDMLHDGQFQR